MLVHDNEVAPFEPVRVVKVKSAPEVALAVQEFVLIAIAFEPGTRDGLESLAQFEGRSSRLAAIGERPDELEAQRAVISLEDVYGLGRGRLGDGDPEALRGVQRDATRSRRPPRLKAARSARRCFQTRGRLTFSEAHAFAHSTPDDASPLNWDS